jgi:hypothetical protein
MTGSRRPGVTRTTLAALAFAGLLPACGYHLAGTVVSLPAEIQAIHVGRIANETRHFGLEKDLAFALEDAISRWGTLRVAQDAADADAVLGGRIRAVDLRPVSFDQADLALQYEISVVADFGLRRVSDGQTVWEIDGMRQSNEYSAVANVVVTSSSQFQQGTLDPGDLPRFTQVQLAESEKRMAMKRLLRELARDAYSLMTEGF